MTTAARRWAQELAGWAVPPEILAAAPQQPFVFPPEMFAPPPPGAATSSRSTQVAADRQPDMLALFAAEAEQRGVPCRTVPGSWPDVADEVPAADVVVSHNVLYNVPDLLGFVRALHQHARRRVVLEITERHPQRVRAPLWRHFWDLDRPTGPDARLAVQALREAGFTPTVETSTATARDQHRAAPVEAAFWCRQLCLPAEREPEVAALMRDVEFPTERVTLWWDVPPG